MNNNTNQIPTLAKTLEEALVNAMHITKLSPLEMIYIYPTDNEELFQLFDENMGLVVGSNDITNRPDVFFSAISNEGESIITVEDCERYAQRIKEFCSENGFNNIDKGFEFTFLGIQDKIYSNELVIRLFMNTTDNRVAHIVDSFNKKTTALQSVSTLTLTDGVLAGTVKLLSENVGFFQKRKNRKINQEIIKLTVDLTSQLEPFFLK